MFVTSKGKEVTRKSEAIDNYDIFHWSLKKFAYRELWDKAINLIGCYLFRRSHSIKKVAGRYLVRGFIFLSFLLFHRLRITSILRELVCLKRPTYRRYSHSTIFIGEYNLVINHNVFLFYQLLRNEAETVGRGHSSHSSFLLNFLYSVVLLRRLELCISILTPMAKIWLSFYSWIIEKQDPLQSCKIGWTVRWRKSKVSKNIL